MATSQPTPILLADPCDWSRWGLQLQLANCPQFTVAGVADTVAELDLQAGCVLVTHTQALGSTPVPALSNLRLRAPQLPVVIIADTPDGAPELLANGATAVVLRDDSTGAIRDAIRAAGDGRRWHSPRVQQVCDQHLLLVKRHHLSESAAQSFHLLAQGMYPLAIAEHRMLSEGTIRNHVAEIREMTGRWHFVELVAWYHQHFDALPHARRGQRSRRAVQPPCLPRLSGGDAELVHLLAADLPVSAIAEARGAQPASIVGAVRALRATLGCADHAALLAWCRTHAPAYAAAEAGPAPVHLTPYQQELVQLHTSGHSIAAIATLRGVTPNAVRKAISKLCKRLGCASKADLVAWYNTHNPDAVLELPTRDNVLELPARDNVLQLPARDAALEAIPTEAAPLALGLTPEQHELVQLHMSGHTSAAIAMQRRVHPSSVRRWMKTIRDLVGCATNAHLFAWYAEHADDALIELPARDDVLDLTPADPILDLAPQDVVAVVSQRAVTPDQVRPARRHRQPLRWLGGEPSLQDRSHHAMANVKARPSRFSQWHGATPVLGRSLSDPPSAARARSAPALAARTLAHARAAPPQRHGIAPPLAAERWGGWLCVR